MSVDISIKHLYKNLMKKSNYAERNGNVFYEYIREYCNDSNMQYPLVLLPALVILLLYATYNYNGSSLHKMVVTIAVFVLMYVYHELLSQH